MLCCQGGAGALKQHSYNVLHVGIDNIDMLRVYVIYDLGNVLLWLHAIIPCLCLNGAPRFCYIFGTTIPAYNKNYNCSFCLCVGVLSGATLSRMYYCGPIISAGQQWRLRYIIICIYACFPDI